MTQSIPGLFVLWALARNPWALQLQDWQLCFGFIQSTAEASLLTPHVPPAPLGLLFPQSPVPPRPQHSEDCSRQMHFPENPSALDTRGRVPGIFFPLIRAERRVSPYHTHGAVKKPFVGKGRNKQDSRGASLQPMTEEQSERCCV